MTITTKALFAAGIVSLLAFATPESASADARSRQRDLDRSRARSHSSRATSCRETIEQPSYSETVLNCAGIKPSLSAIALNWSGSSAAARAASKSRASVKRFAAISKNWLKIIVKSAKVLRR